MNHRPLEIYPVLNGFVVKAGCQLLAYTDNSKLKADFIQYVDDPNSVEKRILELEGLNKKVTMGGAEAPCDVPAPCAPQQEGRSLSNILRNR